MEAVTLETLTLLLAFLTLLGAQIGGMFMLLSRMNDQNKRHRRHERRDEPPVRDR